MDPLVLRAVLPSLGLIRDYVMRAAQFAGLSDQSAYKLALALDEIATNVIVYGYKDMDPVGDIRIRAEIEDDRLRITLEDSGRAFDPRGRELPTAEDLAKDLEERPVGGLGIFLALDGVDEFDYRREGDVNMNIFVMHL